MNCYPSRAHDFARLVTSLRAAYRAGMDDHDKAAAELLIWHGYWLHHGDFASRCVYWGQGEMGVFVASIMWRQAREFYDRCDSGSTSERAVLDLAVAIGENRYKLTIMGAPHRRAIAEAACAAVGVNIAKPPESKVTETQRWLIEETRAAHQRWANRSNPRLTDNPQPMADLLGSLLAVVDQIAPKEQS